jgi:hypothetical protein
MFAIFDVGPAEAAVLLAAGMALSYAAMLGLVLGLFVYVAWQARRRGYSFWLWLLAGLASLNPLLILLVLAMPPDAHKKALREAEMRALETRLGARPPRPAGVAPAASPGDQSTTAPVSRSVGDEETRA